MRTSSSVSWALIAYQLAGICLSVVFGRLGDIHGRYAIYGTGFVVMTVSSALCGLAPSVGWLIVFRLVQGVGAAMIASATRVLAMEALPEGAEGRANGFMTMSFHGGLLLGPPLGGLVIDWLSWRWIFFLLVPIGVAGTVLTMLRARGRRPVPRRAAARRRLRRRGPPRDPHRDAHADGRSAKRRGAGGRTTRASSSPPSSSASSASSSTSAGPSIRW